MPNYTTTPSPVPTPCTNCGRSHTYGPNTICAACMELCRLSMPGARA